MTEGQIQIILILAGLGAAVGVFVALFFVSAPYGRHFHGGWGPTLPNLLGWVLMESPSALVFGLCFALGSAPKNPPLVLFFGMWELHYVHRAFIYPLTLRDGNKQMPVVVMLMAV